MQELERVSGSLFFDLSDELTLAKEIWAQIISDPTFAYKVRQAKTDWIIPTWSEPLDTRYTITPECKSYTVYSVDGSQIYPDRHQGTSCSLINIGTVQLSYGDKSFVDFQSIPYVFTGDQAAQYDNAVDWINCRRQEYEFAYGIKMVNSSQDNQLLLFDGSLIFWHLDSKNLEMHAQFLSSYLGSLYQLSKQ